MSSKQDYAQKLRDVKELERLLKERDGLPHLYGQKFYPWARKFFDSRNHETLLCSANQVGKSSVAIRKIIHWATAKNLWPELWPSLQKNQAPNLMWYLYPTAAVATSEFESKWVPQFLPRNEFKTHPTYGWTEEWEKGYISKIRFNSGVQIHFKFYSQKIKDLQTSSVYYINSDEEMPIHFLSEIKARLNATGGHWSMVFTATTGDPYWRATMEPTNRDEERHPEALKIQVSLYDSQMFEDGTPSHWTEKKIEAAKANCPTEAEIQRRVYGRFVKSQGLKLESFDLQRNMTEAHPLPGSWMFYGGVDPGSGGQSGHPAAMIILAVSPDYKQGRVFKFKRLDGIPTAASDILDHYRAMRGNLPMVSQVYDWSSRDFFTYASRIGESFIPAEKARDAGFGLLNTLFKNSMLKLPKGDSEVDKLVQEICSLPMDYDKRKTLDDGIDALRYACMAVPWDFSDVESSIKVEDALSQERMPPKIKTELELRREFTLGLDQKADEFDIDQEFDIWGELAGTSE